MLVVAGGMFAIFFFATLYVQQILRLLAGQAGLGFLPLTVGIVLGLGPRPALIPRFGVRNVALAGTAIATAGLLLFSRVSVDGSYLTDVLPALLVMSVGLGLTFVPLTLIATTGVDGEDAGLPRACSTPPSRSAARSGWPSSRPWPRTSTSSALDSAGRHRGPARAGERAGRRLPGRFLGGAALVAIGFVLIATLIRRRDVALIDRADGYVPEESAPRRLAAVPPSRTPPSRTDRGDRPIWPIGRPPAPSSGRDCAPVRERHDQVVGDAASRGPSPRPSRRTAGKPVIDTGCRDRSVMLLSPVVMSWKYVAGAVLPSLYRLLLILPTRLPLSWSASAARPAHCGEPAVVPPKRKTRSRAQAAELHTARTPPLMAAL